MKGCWNAHYFTKIKDADKSFIINAAKFHKNLRVVYFDFMVTKNEQWPKSRLDLIISNLFKGIVLNV